MRVCNQTIFSIHFTHILNRSFHFSFFSALSRSFSLCMKYVFRSIIVSRVDLLLESVSCIVQMTLWENNRPVTFPGLWMMTVETIGQCRRTSMVNTQCTFRILNVRKRQKLVKNLSKKRNKIESYGRP